MNTINNRLSKLKIGRSLVPSTFGHYYIPFENCLQGPMLGLSSSVVEMAWP